MAYRDRFIRVNWRSIDSVKRGDLIRSHATPNFVNLVHKVETGDKDDITIFSTRFANYYGGKFRLLNGSRARPFNLIFHRCRSGWEIVEHIRSETVDHTSDINALLNRGFSVWVDPDEQSDEEQD